MRTMEELPDAAARSPARSTSWGDKWALLVAARDRPGEQALQRHPGRTGAPRERLSARLSALVDAGVLETPQYSDAPPRSSYHLTPAGRDLLRSCRRSAVGRPVGRRHAAARAAPPRPSDRPALGVPDLRRADGRRRRDSGGDVRVLASRPHRPVGSSGAGSAAEGRRGQCMDSAGADTCSLAARTDA
jgi:DNA-binding HxlR family transcriptional regulator